jgi:hypothetical protein
MGTDIFVHMITECLRKLDILIQENFSEAKRKKEKAPAAKKCFL